MYKLFGITKTAHIIIGILLLICECLTPFIVAKIAEKLWDKQTALFALYMSLFWPQLLLFSGLVNSLPLYNFILIAACLVLFHSGLSIYRKALLCGLLLGLYGNFRFEGLLFLLPFIYCIFRNGSHKKEFLKTKLSASAIMASIFLLMLTPWIVRNHLVFDKIVLSTSGGFNLLRGHHEKATGTGRDYWPSAQEKPYEITPVPQYPYLADLSFSDVNDELKLDTWQRETAVSFILSNPGKEIRLFFSKLYYFLTTDFTHPICRKAVVWVPSLLALLFGFIYFVARFRHNISMQTLWMIFTIQGGLSCIFFILPRYRMNVEFIPLLFFAAFIASLYNKYLRSNN